MSIENPFNNPPQEAPKAETERRWTKEQIDMGVAFARSLFEKGYLSDGEVNAIAAAHDFLRRGKATEGHIRLLVEWADRAEWSKMREQNDAKLRRHVVQELGRDILEDAESSGRSIDHSIKIHLLESKEQNAADVARVANLWREFSGNLFNRLIAENLRDPKKVEAALELANALLQAEPTREGKDAAKRGIEALKKRYGI